MPVPHSTDKFVGYAALEKGTKVERYEYTPEPLGDSDVQIRVTHNGLCHSDVHMTMDDFGVAKFPFIPGHEVIGVVEDIGGNVTHLKPGDRVGVAWIKDSCRACRNCTRGEENLCVKGYTGTILMGNHGGWQKQMRTPADFAYKIPDGLDSVTAAPLLCAGLTVYAPLKKYVTRPGMSVGVIGIGGLGHLALQFAKALGCEVSAFSSSPNKEEEAKQLGAHHFVCGEKAMKSVEGTFDVLINTVSSATDYKQQMQLLAKGGTLCLVGLATDEIKGLTPADLVFNGKQLVGSVVGGRADMQEMLDMCAVTGVKAMCQTMPLSKVNEAIELLLANKPRYRIVLETDL